jgi:hypothetical protein
MRNLEYERFRLKKYFHYVNRFTDYVARGYRKTIFPIIHKTLKGGERDGTGSTEASEDNGYDVSGWASVEFGDTDADGGYGADCGGPGSGGVSFVGGMGRGDL